MNKQFTSSILLVFAIAAKATLPVFTIGTNEFSFVFQDSVVQGMIDGVDESFTMQIPIQRAFPSRIRNSSVPAVWMDGRWKVYVIQW